MALDIAKVEYYTVTVDGHAAEGFEMLSVFAGAGVDLLAFKAVPVDHNRTQFSLFPDDSKKMTDGAKESGLALEGPHPALIIKGDDDESGALGRIYEKLAQAGVTVYESSGIAHVWDRYGVVLYLTPEECEKALAALTR